MVLTLLINYHKVCHCHYKGVMMTQHPLVTPHSRCRLRLLKMERIKDFLLMEEEFILNQERLKPSEEKNEV